MRRPILVSLAVLFGSAPGLAQETGDPLEGFDAYVQEAVVAWDVPGLAVAVVQGDSVLFSQGYGMRELGRDEPVNEHTLFANASTTKAFTAVAAGMLVDEDRIEWDEPVSERLPEFVLLDPWVTREITLRDLLTHRVGFGDPSFLWYGADYEFDDYASHLRYQEPATSFRSYFAYNNIGYAAAGEITAREADTSWDELIRTRILDPLGMNETLTRGADLVPGSNVAIPHDMVGDTLISIGWNVSFGDNIAPAGSMYSSVHDMTRWMRFLLAGCEWEGEKLLSSESCEELLKPQAVLTPNEFYPSQQLTEPWFIGYSLGWFLQDYRGEKAAFHTGSLDGYVAIVGLLPKRRAGVVVFANRDHAEVRHALMLRVFDALIGEPIRDWSTELKEMYDERAARADQAREKRRASRVPDTEPSLPLDSYVGRWGNDLYGHVDAKLEALEGDGTELHLVLVRSDYLTADLGHWHYDTFEARWRPGWLRPELFTFEVGSGGTVDVLHLGGHELRRQDIDQ
jgi:CubicO group peptidase (beta-lactamase class C family)